MVVNSILRQLKTRPTLERQTTLGRLRSMINHFPNQSQTCELLKNIFYIEKTKSGAISGWTDKEKQYRLSIG